jgi:hypothetical protein
MGVTGNSDMNKDTLAKNINFISIDERQEGIPFIKRVLKRKDILGSIDSIEDRFLPDDKEFLKIVVQ